MSKYKTIVFDIDGTLLNTDLYICLAFLNLFQKYRKEYMYENIFTKKSASV